MTAEQLRAKKAQIEKERDDFVKQANAQIERLTGAIILLDQLITECETPGRP